MTNYSPEQRQADAEIATTTPDYGSPAETPDDPWGSFLGHAETRRTRAAAGSRAGIPGKELVAWDRASEDRELAELVAQMAAVAPALRQYPGVLLETAQSARTRGDAEWALRDLRHTDTFIRMRVEVEQLRGHPPALQHDLFSRMPRGVQNALQRQGYRLPVDKPPEPERESSGIGGALLDAGGWAVDKAAWAARNSKIPVALGEAVDTANDAANLAGSAYRTMEYLNAEEGAADSPLGNNIVRDPGRDVANIFRNPGNTLDVFNAAREGERFFLPKEARAVEDLYDDPEHYLLVTRLAAGETIAELTEELVPGGLGTPEYAEALKQVTAFSTNEIVVEGVERLQNAKISFGRSMARGVGLQPGDALWSTVSGLADAGFIWFADPTLVAGKARHVIQFQRYGLARFLGAESTAGDVIRRVNANYGTDLAARAAKRKVTDVTDKNYWRSLRARKGSETWMNNRERAAVVLFDHAKAGEWDRLVQAMPGTSRLETPLRQWMLDEGLDTVDDIRKFFGHSQGMSALVNGNFANYLEDFVALPRLNRVGTVRARAKFDFEESVDFFSRTSVRLKERIRADELVDPNQLAMFDDPATAALATGFRPQEGGVLDRTLGRYVMQPMANATIALTKLIPKEDVLRFNNPSGNEVFRQLLDFGVGGAKRRAIYDSYINATGEAAKRAVAQSAIQTVFANLGMLDAPDYKGFVTKWLNRNQQSFALDGVDELVGPNGRLPAGVWPVADVADAIAIPRFREIAAQARRNNFTGMVTGVTNSENAERFMRYWKPAVILRPAFALRAGGEEAFSQFARFGPGHIVKQWIVLPLAAKRTKNLEGTWVTLDQPGWIARRVGNTATRISHRHALGMAVADHTAHIGNRLRVAARGIAPNDEQRYLRDLAENTWVHQQYEEIGGAVGVQADAALPQLPPSEYVRVGPHDNQRVLEFRKIGSDQDVYTDADILKPGKYGARTARLQGDPVAEVRASVRSIGVPKDQANRLGRALGEMKQPGYVNKATGEPMPAVAYDGATQPYRAIGDARRLMRELTPRQREAVEQQIIQGDHDGVMRFLASVGKQKKNTAYRDLGRRMALMSTNDAFALLTDTSKALKGVDIDDAAEAWLKRREAAEAAAKPTPKPVKQDEDAYELAQRLDLTPPQVEAFLFYDDLIEGGASEADALATASQHYPDEDLWRQVRDGWDEPPDVAGLEAQFDAPDPLDALDQRASAIRARAERKSGEAVWEMVRLAERGDDEALRALENMAGVARMREPEIYQKFTLKMDRMGPLAGVQLADVKADEKALAIVSRLRKREGRTSEGLIADLDSLSPVVARLEPAYQGVVDELADAYRGVVTATAGGGKPDRALMDGLSRQIEAGEARLDDLLDDLGPLLSGGTPVDEALENASQVQAITLDQLFTDDDGVPINAVSYLVGQGRFDPKLLLNTDMKLPSRVIGPRMQEVIEPTGLAGLTERVTRWGFNKLGEQVAQMARRPLWSRNYTIASREAEALLRPLLRNEAVHGHTAALLGDNLDDYYDVIDNALALRAEDLSRPSDVKDIDEISDRELFEIVSELDSPPAGRRNAQLIRAFYKNEHHVRHEVTRVAATRATANTVPFIDDHRIRSQYQEYARNITPFWFAQEQFIKRWARTFKHSPEAIRRAELAHHAIYSVGWLETDEFDNEVFTYPASAWGVQLLSKLADWMPGDRAYTLPVAAAMTGELQYAAPGLDGGGTMPHQNTGPLVSLGTRLIRQFSPEFGTRLEQSFMSERAQGRAIPDIVVPTSIMRVWRWATADDEAIAMATIGAMQMMEANDPDSTPTSESTDMEVKQYVDRVANHARITLLMKAIVGATGPASPRTDFDPNDLAADFKDLLQSGLDIDEAVAMFLKLHPDGDSYTVFGSRVPGKAPLRPTDEVFDALADNKSFYGRYTMGSSWLLPNDAAPTEPFSRAAYTALLSNDMRVRKTPEQMYRDIEWQAAADPYFRNKDAYEAAAANPELSSQAKFDLDQRWKVWKADYMATHRIFAEDLTNSNHNTRMQVLAETEAALADPELPGGITHAAELGQMVTGYRGVMARMNELNADPLTANTERGRALKKDLKVRFRDWCLARSESHPTLKAFWSRILEPELDLPDEAPA